MTIKLWPGEDDKSSCGERTVADECNLVLGGFLAFGDPLLPDAHAAIATLQRDGVQAKIITGQSESGVTLGTLIPFTPLARPMGFTPLPPVYFAFLTVATVTYLLLVEIVKRRLMPSVITKNCFASPLPRPQE